jgi:hypothetical protein
MSGMAAPRLALRVRREGLFATGLLLAIHLGAAWAGEAPPPAGRSASAVTEIALERDCFGCAAGSMLVLRRSGTATYTITGKARHGTADHAAEGVVRPRDFDTLARLLVTQGFFEMRDEYGDPQQQDGEWVIVAAVRDGQRKHVFERNQAGPPSLQAIERAIDSVRVRIFGR